MRFPHSALSLSLVLFFMANASVHAMEPLAYIPRLSAESTHDQGRKDLLSGVHVEDRHAVGPVHLQDTAVRPERRLETDYDRLSPANRKARNSVTMGILSVCSFATLFLFPPLALAAVPLGILAIVKGQEAKKGGATRPQGTTLGIIGLSLFVVGLFFVAAILVAATAWW